MSNRIQWCETFKFASIFLILPLDDLKPILECVLNSPEGYRAYFGYSKATDDLVELEVGSDNLFKPFPQDRSQPNEFTTKRSRPYPLAAFSVLFNSNITWQLNGYEVTASKSLPHCITSSASFNIILHMFDTIEAVEELLTNTIVDIAGVTEEQIMYTRNEETPGILELTVTIEKVTGGKEPITAMKDIFGPKFDILTEALAEERITYGKIEVLESGIEIYGSQTSPIVGYEDSDSEDSAENQPVSETEGADNGSAIKPYIYHFLPSIALVMLLIHI